MAEFLSDVLWQVWLVERNQSDGVLRRFPAVADRIVHIACRQHLLYTFVDFVGERNEARRS